MIQTAVMGGGALGMLLAARLAAGGRPVSLWTRTQEQADRINAAGLTLEDAASGVSFAVQLEAVPFTGVQAGFSGHLLLALKQTALTLPLLQMLSTKLAEQAALVLFQNGIGHVEKIAEMLPGRQLRVAVTTEGALRTGTASVRHTGIGETWLGEWPEASAGAGPDPVSAEIGAAMKQAGFSVFVSKQMRERVLRKLLVNAVINPLTALWRVPNGELPATPERKTAMERLFRETADILQPQGLDTDPAQELWNLVLEVCASTAGNRSSMLQDVLAGRETEIDALNGAICRMAGAEGKEAPWNAAVTALVKAILSPKERGV